MLRKGWIINDADRAMEDILRLERHKSIADVIQRYSKKDLRLQMRQNGELIGLCPFHADRKVGSFFVYPEKNTCKCWSCNHGGGPVKAVATLLNMDIAEAALQMAVDFGDIDEAQYQSLSGHDYKKLIQKKRPTSFAFPKEPEISDTELDVRDKVYSSVMKHYGLTAEHKAYLKKVRHLTDAQIERDFFTLPGKEIASAIKAETKLSDEQLSVIPGFFLEKNPLNGTQKPGMYAPSGIGIIIRDAKGRAAAIQIRDMAKDSACRYRYLSGKFPKSDYFEGGGTVGTPIDVEYPTIFWNDRYAVTEGKFKADILCRAGYLVFSVQGVNNFRGIMKEINNLPKKYRTNARQEMPGADIFYDADFIGNKNVCSASIKLGEYLEENGFSTRIAYWNEDVGKGIDDKLIADPDSKSRIRFMTVDRFKKLYLKNETQANMDAGFAENVRVGELTIEDAENIRACFKKEMQLDFFGKRAEL